jgi:hypothetical protein
MPEKKNELLRELKAKMGCGDIEEGTTDFYDFMDKIVDHHPKISDDKKEDIKSELRSKVGCGDVEELKDDYDFLNK